VRLAWILLAVLGILGVEFLGGTGAGSLVVLPLVALVTDLAFQSVRFRIPRFPDAALATGLFLSLLLPPSVPLAAAATLALAAIGFKHVVRYRGRPVLNPAAAGVVAGAFLFGIAPAWWAGVGPWGEEILIAFGVALILRGPAAWRLPVAFFAIYGPVSVAMKVILGAALAPKLLLLGVLDPATLFFGLYMVVEPRTAPANRRLYPLYGATIAVGAVFLPLVMPGPGVLLALLLTNFGAACVRFALDARPVPGRKATVSPAGRSGTSARHRRYYRAEKTARPDWPAWSVARRATAAVLLVVVVGVFAATTSSQTSTPPVNVGVPPLAGGGGGGSHGGSGGTGGGIAATCIQDNPSIPSATLDALHKALGPSVILSYDPSTGTTVFYDPVNSVTVTETDLYEDYGQAEFNGDDFAVSGCSP
jgi:Na+-translocating ferredoxin:NAD+ oxidoreductase RnfD subunit